MKRTQHTLQRPGTAHHHVIQAHHAGLVIGVAAGSTAVTAVLAAFLVISSPSLVLHPLDLRSQLAAGRTADAPAPVSTVPIAGAAVSSFEHTGMPGAASASLTEQ